MKRILGVILSSIIIAALFAGCNQNEILTEPGPKDVIYKFAEFTPEGEIYDILVGFAFENETVYMLTQKIEAGEGSTVENFYLLKLDAAGNLLEKELISSATEEQQADIGYKTYMGLCVGKSGEVYLVRETALNTARPKSELRFWSSTEGEIPDPRLSEEELRAQESEIEPETKTEIVRRDGDTETVVAEISGKLEPLGVETTYLYVSDFEIDNKGFAYITVNTNSVYAFDLSTGEMVFDNKPIPKGGYIRGLYKNAKGEVCVVIFKQLQEDGATLQQLLITPINPKTNKFGKEEVLDAPGGINSNIAPGDDRFTYYAFTPSKIYGCTDSNRILVADLPESGVNLYEITRIIPISETQFLITGYTLENIGIEKLYSLTKIDPKDVPDKSTITVAAVGEPRHISDYIKEFKLSHPHIQVDYKQYAVDSNASYDQAFTAFNNDIIAGNIPDVIIIEPDMPYGNYVKKGLLADLYPFIDNDPDYSREDFLEPLLKAFETDGKLYSITPAFSIDALVGKTSIFGEKQGQSLEELQAAAAKIPGANLFGTSVNRDVFTNVILTSMARGFIDDINGVCSFDSEEFITLLEYAKTLPPPAPDAEPYELILGPGYSFSQGDANDYKNNRTLIELIWVYDFRHIVSLEKMEFGEPITFLGLPNVSGDSGILATPRLELAIMEKASNPDGAWEFVKGLFSYRDYFINSMGYPPLFVLPTLMSELEIAAEKATIPAYETASNGERFPRLNWMGANLSGQPDNTEADNAKMFTLFDSISGIERSVPAIENIIKEETAVYYAGAKTAEETARIIQNRATTYLEETRG
jgi:ABC-type glycerol-3-phosphate transport system substrate-binding protein